MAANPGEVARVVSPRSNSNTSGIDFKSQVLAATDIVQLIGQTVGLKKRGKDFLGLCPFHSEKTPSFHVNPVRQSFYCFGCKEHGNAIDFVIKRDKVQFIDALRSLGQAAGLEMPSYGGSSEKKGERQALLDAHVATVSYFESWLQNPEVGKPARDYLAKRGFTDETIKKWRLGVAVDAWDALLRSPVAKKYPPPLLATAGLVKARENGNGFYDTFRNRLMFPIRNESGQTIAFGGRVMPGSSDPAKYLNSPETPLFFKGRCLFGLDMAKQRILETRTVVIVEGYTDVIMAHQYGASNVVSILGTGMTEAHVNVLRRFADRIVLLLDADEAGDSAADRIVSLFLTQPIEIAIAAIPQGLDPDEFLLQQGLEAFDQVVADATDVLTHKWKMLARQFMERPNDLTGQQKAVEEYLELLSRARGTGPVDAIRWGSALARVSRLTEIPIDELNRRFKVARTPRPAATNLQTAQESSVAQPTVSGPTRPPNAPLTARDRAERWVLGLLLLEPHRWPAVQVHVHVEDFGDARHRRIAEVYWAHQRDEGEPVFNSFLELLREQTNDPSLTELTVQLVDEVEGLSSDDESQDARRAKLDEMLDGSLKFFAELKEARERQKLFASLQRTSEEKLSEQDELSLLEALVKKNQSPNLRRLGPVKRIK